eukprot:jgi/Psemu1/29268/gm1.29268_g
MTTAIFMPRNYHDYLRTQDPSRKIELLQEGFKPFRSTPAAALSAEMIIDHDVLNLFELSLIHGVCKHPGEHGRTPTSNGNKVFESLNKNSTTPCLTSPQRALYFDDADLKFIPNRQDIHPNTKGINVNVSLTVLGKPGSTFCHDPSLVVYMKNNVIHRDLTC